MTSATDISTTNNTAKNRLTHLMTFLKKEVESEERIHMAKACFDTTDPAKNKDKKRTRNDRDQGIATATGLFSIKESNTKCLFCEDHHDSLNCEKARSIPME